MTGDKREDKLWEDLFSKGSLSVELQEEFIGLFGERGKKAVLAVAGCRVKRYLDFIVVVGTNDEYIVEDEFCTCPARLYRGRSCWHVLAARIAVLTGQIEDLDEWYQDTLK